MMNEISYSLFEEKNSRVFLSLGKVNCGSLVGLHTTAGGVASVGERVTFSSPDENARAGETAQKSQCQPTLATPLVVACALISCGVF